MEPISIYAFGALRMQFLNEIGLAALKSTTLTGDQDAADMLYDAIEHVQTNGILKLR